MLVIAGTSVSICGKTLLYIMKSGAGTLFATYIYRNLIHSLRTPYQMGVVNTLLIESVSVILGIQIMANPSKGGDAKLPV
jgi:hypothetical protein